MEFRVLDSQTHELVVVAHDESFQACIALHNTNLGPALGGVRMKYYSTPQEMVKEALSLSENMSYKNAVAGLPYGGGKSVINAPVWSKEIADKYAQLLNYVNQGEALKYIAAPDMNTNNDCMKDIQDAGGTHCFYEPSGGDCSDATALGVFGGLQAISSFVGVSGKDFTVNIEGVGKVGKGVLELCVKEGWDVCISDLDTELAKGLAGHYEVAFAAPEDIKYLDGSYCPCAQGGTVDEEFVENSEARAICGAANNQLTNLKVGMLLATRNKLHIPDFIANSGGVIAAGLAFSGAEGEPFGLENPSVKERVEFIRKQASALLLAQTTGADTRNAQLIAMKVAKDMVFKDEN